MDINIWDNQNNLLQDDYVVIALDSTRINITNRGQWIADKCGMKKNDTWKYNISVNVKSSKIISIKNVNDEHVHDSNALPDLIHNIIKPNKTVGILFADGAYDGNTIIKCIADNGILPCNKVRKNA